ncbi:MAG: response regulator [Candidatus Marsarchaeota archaeon]|nr:response regulator [Candidatus Marsarchaeota archaeon]
MTVEEQFKEDIIGMLNDRQQVSFNEIRDIAFSRGIAEKSFVDTLTNLEKDKIIASRRNGGILTYYMLQQQDHLKNIIIVEDDKNINKLMALSIGKGYNITQIYDGGEAVTMIRKQKPDLVILDLMLPNKDGLDICQTIKSDPEIKDTIVILVSAMDPTNNRFKGIKYGADYYIKKPFDPSELRTLVTLFLEKKGKRFDPLIDLPDEERISNEIERSIKEGKTYTIGTLKIDELGNYASRIGEHYAIIILRLVSQLLQDAVNQHSPNIFVGFLNGDEFVIAGIKDNVEKVIHEVQKEFNAVMPFLLQDAGYKKLDLNIDSLFETDEVPKLSLSFTESEKEKLEERRNEVLKSKGITTNDIGSYTYDELQQIFGKENFDIIITRDLDGVKMRVGKKNNYKEEKNNKDE